jgi:hypothetical protein
MAAGTGRLDLCVLYGGSKYPLEVKIRYNEKTEEKGVEQTRRYMEVYGSTEGWLAIFDRRPEIKWDDKLYMKKETAAGKTVTVVGL